MRPPQGERTLRLAAVRRATNVSSFLPSLPVLKEEAFGRVSSFLLGQWRAWSPGLLHPGPPQHTFITCLSCSDYWPQGLCLFLHCTSNVQFRTHHPNSLSHQHTFPSSAIPNP